MKKLAILLMLFGQAGAMAAPATIATGGEQGIYYQVTN